MRKLPFLLLLCASYHISGQTCNPQTGNVVIFANYDGGTIHINCDVNIPNLKIGVCTYENCQINVTGPYAGNLAGFIYAGFQGTGNANCAPAATSATVSAPWPGTPQYLFAPPGVLNDPNGYPSIICAYSCGPGNQGGCNTSAQVVAYFLNQFGGTLHTYYTQYACWNDATFNLSDQLCCSLQQPDLEVSFTASDPVVCVGQCISYTSEISNGTASAYNWIFPGAVTTSSGAPNPQNICYLTPGTYTTTLTASNGSSEGTHSSTLTVIDCGLNNCSCPADLNADGIIGVADLQIFLGLFGTTCN